MNFKKLLSKTLAITLTAGVTLSGFAGIPGLAMQDTVEAADTNVTRDRDPWSNTDLPSLNAKKDPNVDKEKFTHNEWTGTKYTDKDKKTVYGEDVFGLNVQPASTSSTTSVAYESVDKAIKGARDYDKDASGYVQFLTGTDKELSDWDLVVVQNQKEAQGNDYKNFYKKDYKVDTSKKWKRNLTLPYSWTYYGFDHSIYTNVPMPFQTDYDPNVKVPAAPTNYNPVGLYRKTFDLDDSMLDENGRVYISFQGVESAYYVYVNGKEVGYSEDTYSPHSFDITDYLTDNGKDNLLAVKVHKFCDGTWFEDQDMIYDGGIFRDVYLYSTPLVHIEDYFVRTDLKDNYKNADMKLDVTLSNRSDAKVSDYAVDVQLFDADGKPFMQDFQIDFDGIDAAKSDGTKTTQKKTASKTVYAPKLWSCEDPNLYTMVLSLYNKKTGNYVESISQQLGFREIEFTSAEVDNNGKLKTDKKKFQQMKINGQPFYLKGVNRHDTDPLYGKHVPKATLEEDIFLMKKFNFNAIRTGHYPNDEYLYYLAEKYGLYVMCEANVEAHALMNDKESKDSKGNKYFVNDGNKGNGDAQKLFKELVHDRTVTNFQRLKNRTCNMFWSIGNENFYKSDCKNYADGMFYDAIWYYKNNDGTRPVHCESAYDNNGVDIYGTMYKRVNEVYDKAKNGNMFPYIQCEYSHAMGNACGNFKEYWDAFRSAPNLLGGFIWDWVDQARYIKRPNNAKYNPYTEENAHTNLYKDKSKESYFGYGGDWGEKPNNNNFCVNGVISPDRDPQPEVYEVKYQQQNFWFDDTTSAMLQNGKVKVYNESSFDNLNEYDLVWTLKEDDKIIGTGTESVDVKARETKEVSIPFRSKLPANKKAGAEYYLNISVRLKADTDWAKKGHEIAHEQLQVPANVQKVEKTISKDEVKVQESGNDITVTGKKFSFKISKSTGIMSNYKYNGDTLLTEGPKPNFWRALTDNDQDQVKNEWQAADDNVKASSVKVTKNSDGQNVITTVLSFSGNDKIKKLKETVVYTIDGSGAVTVKSTINGKDTDLARFRRIGANMVMPEGYENVSYYGNGYENKAIETMYDRKSGGVLAKYDTTVSELFYPYVKTQDTGTLTDTKWFTVTNSSKKNAMVFAATDTIEATALHFNVDDLHKAKHPHEMTERKETIVSINLGSEGTGNSSCGGDTHDEYKFFIKNEYNYEYTMIPYNTDEQKDMTELTRPYRTVATSLAFEAESGKLSGEAKVENKANFSNGQMVGYIGGEQHSTVTFDVEAAEDKECTMTIVYTGKDRDFTVKVNDKEYTVDCPNTADWNTTGTTTLKVDIKKGKNTIVFGGVGNAYAPNLDGFDIDLPVVEEVVKPAEPTVIKLDTKVEAETGALSGSAQIAVADDCSGKAYLGSLGGPDKGAATFKVNATDAGDYTVTVTYCSEQDRKVNVQVNGTDYTGDCGKADSWDAPAETPAKVNIKLNAGDNTIVITGAGEEYAPNIDCFEIKKAEAEPGPGPDQNTDLETAKKNLDATVEEAEKLIENGQNDYTDASWSKFEEAYKAATEVKEAATVEELVELRKNLETAKNNLSENVDPIPPVEDIEWAKEELAAEVEEVEGIIVKGKGDYTDESWNALLEAYDAATNLKEDADFDEVNDMRKQLEAAKDNLAVTSGNGGQKPDDPPYVPQPDNEEELKTAKQKLKTAIDAASEIYAAGNEDGIYTNASWVVFEAAFKGAEAAEEDATVTELNDLRTRLAIAQKTLKLNDADSNKDNDAKVEAAEKELQSAVKAVTGIYAAGQSNYTDDSWAAFVKAYEAAENPKDSITAEELDNLRTELKVAQDGLKQKTAEPDKKPDTNQPQTGYINQVTVTAGEDTLYYGGNAGKTTTVELGLPDGAAKQSVTYSTSNAKVAKVDAAGNITAVKKGNAVITVNVTLTNGESKTFSLNVAVKKAYIEKVNVKSGYKVGKKATLKAKAYGSTKRITWKIKSGAKYAKLTKSGKFTARAKGKVRVVAKAGKISKTFTIRIK